MDSNQSLMGRKVFESSRVKAGILAVIVLASPLLASRPGQAELSPISPYAAQQNSPIRGLSAQEVEDLRQGRGAGFARMAELNQYPGPRHVLDLKQQLGLSTAQAVQIEAVFDQMQAESRQLGQEILQRESRLSAAFSRQTLSAAELQRQTSELGALYGKLRAAHLQAHLQITPLLSAEQIAQYNRLRGYSQPSDLPGRSEHSHPGS